MKNLILGVAAVLAFVLAIQYLLWESIGKKESYLGYDSAGVSFSITHDCFKVEQLIKTQTKFPPITVMEYFRGSDDFHHGNQWLAVKTYASLGDDMIFKGTKMVDGYCYAAFSSKDGTMTNVFRYSYGVDSVGVSGVYENLLNFLYDLAVAKSNAEKLAISKEKAINELSENDGVNIGSGNTFAE